jgi:hypothetical protein
MFILLSCICRVLGTKGEPRMSAMCAFAASRTSFFLKEKKTKKKRYFYVHHLITQSKNIIGAIRLIRNKKTIQFI